MAVWIPKHLDVFYISYDEPNAEANWANVRMVIPHAKRVHGVKGFEAAHKTCALASATDRFMTIDGDNWIDARVFEQEQDDGKHPDAVYSWKSKNTINGLEYGNGGLKCWQRDVLLASSTHEGSNDTDFCWVLRYFQVNTVGSTSVNNATPFQAWRAGFREGVKMSYIDGKPMADPARQIGTIPQGNLSKLNVWMSVGRDADNGIWAMLGARSGYHMLYTGQIRETVINDYDWFRSMWNDISDCDPDREARWMAVRLEEDLGFYVPELNAQASTWFRTTYINPPRGGLML